MRQSTSVAKRQFTARRMVSRRQSRVQVTTRLFIYTNTLVPTGLMSDTVIIPIVYFHVITNDSPIQTAKYSSV